MMLSWFTRFIIVRCKISSVFVSPREERKMHTGGNKIPVSKKKTGLYHRA
jgi:hypothetical protein